MPTLVGSSGSGTSAEEVNLAQSGGRHLHGRGAGLGRGRALSPFKLHTWLLGSAAAGNMTVTAPATAVVGQTGAITSPPTAWPPATKYLGSVAYGGTTGMPNPTIVRIDAP